MGQKIQYTVFLRMLKTMAHNQAEDLSLPMPLSDRPGQTLPLEEDDTYSAPLSLQSLTQEDLFRPPSYELPLNILMHRNLRLGRESSENTQRLTQGDDCRKQYTKKDSMLQKDETILHFEKAHIMKTEAENTEAAENSEAAENTEAAENKVFRDEMAPQIQCKEFKPNENVKQHVLKSTKSTSQEDGKHQSKDQLAL